MIDPERDPREHDDEDGRQVRLEDEVADVALQPEGERQPLVEARRQLLHAVVGLVADDGELRQLGVVDTHHRRLAPPHDHVRHRVTVYPVAPFKSKSLKQ